MTALDRAHHLVRQLTATACSMEQLLDRARGCLLGQFVGDALGTTVEFSSSADIARRFPDGLREIVGGGPFQLLPGQVTDDGELALAMARALAERGRDVDAIARAYVAWRNSDPFDIGLTTANAFRRLDDPSTLVEIDAWHVAAEAMAANGRPDAQANGSLMRIAPLGLFAVYTDPAEAASWAREDSRLSHPSQACQEACAVFVVALRTALRGGGPDAVFAAALDAADTDHGRAHGVWDALVAARDEPAPVCDGSGQGWVILALRNAFHHLLHAASVEAALVATVMAGGDTDTTAAIAGALLGAVHGESALPARWRERVLGCVTQRGPTYQTTDARTLAARLLAAGLGWSASRGASGALPTRPAPQTDPADPGHRAGGGGVVRTSATHPIEVGWLPAWPGEGALGLTFAPGKRDGSATLGGRWHRDLRTDLERLRDDHGAAMLVCLLSDQELDLLGIPEYPLAVAAAGLALVRLAVDDGDVPADPDAFTTVIATIDEAVRAGDRVIAHCRGGLGRAGTVGGCWLRSRGVAASAVFEALAVARGPHCPENRRQRAWVDAWPTR